MLFSMTKVHALRDYIFRDESLIAILSLAGPNYKFMHTPHMFLEAVSIRAGCWVTRCMTQVGHLAILALGSMTDVQFPGTYQGY